MCFGNVLEDDVLYVSEYNSHTLEEETEYVPLHLRLLVALRFVSSIHGKAQMDLNESQHEHQLQQSCHYHHHRFCCRIVLIISFGCIMLSRPYCLNSFQLVFLLNFYVLFQ